MAILHYTIGLPPLRRGGSVQYAYDLVHEQSKSDKVFVLVCGDALLRIGKSSFKKLKGIDGVEVYKLTNPLTPTLIYGTAEPNLQLRNISIDYETIGKFIKKNNIKVIHLHTLQGLHKDIIKYIKGFGVTVVYTSHDFHGICPHYNLINYNGILCSSTNAVKCALCNRNEPSDFFLRMINSDFFQFMKKFGVLSFFQKLLSWKKNSSSEIIYKDVQNERKIDDYLKLLEYYKDYFRLIDKFHFNSSQTKNVFQTFLPNIDGKVIPVVTSGIKDKRKPLTKKGKITFGFIGNLNDYKGFPFLKEVLIELYKEGYTNFSVKVYADNQCGKDLECPCIEYKAKYGYSEIDDIFYNLDCLIVPSKWYETFSLVTLESLAHGRPVIVSDKVGAKDIVAIYDRRLIFSSSKELKIKLKAILDNPEFLIEVNKNILSSKWLFSLENHAKDIIKFYNE